MEWDRVDQLVGEQEKAYLAIILRRQFVRIHQVSPQAKIAS
jgi:hypothetical protein